MEKTFQFINRSDCAHVIFRYVKKLLCFGIKRANSSLKEDRERKRILRQERKRISIEEIKRQQQKVFDKKVVFSILVPLFNTPADYLQEMIDSVFKQTYPRWELCLADGSDAEHAYVGEICRKKAENDSRIIYQKLKKNGGISENSNECIEMSTGDYIALFDHDDLLHPYALYEYMNAICEEDADFIYSDECSFHKNPMNAYWLHFKPDYAPDTLRGSNYICHFTAFKRSLLEKAGGGFRKKYDGSQDYDLILRLTEQAEHIVHIPRILYYWRSHIQSTASRISSKPYTIEAGRKAITDHLNRIGIKGIVDDCEVPCTYKIQYEIAGNPLISIIVSCKEYTTDLGGCLDSICNKSTWNNWEVIVVVCNSEEPNEPEYRYNILKDRKIEIIKWDGEASISAINNFGAQYARGEYILLLNEQIDIITPDWLEQMLMYAQRKDVGAVGAMIYNSDYTVRHGGIILGADGTTESLHRGYKRGEYGYANRMIIAQNLSAVSGECIMISKTIWDHVHGMDREYRNEFADVDLCMRIREAGYLVVWTPFAELHYQKNQKKKRKISNEQEEMSKYTDSERFKKKWGNILADGDPYYNSNMV